MASSSYYYRKYKEKKKEVREYESNIKEIQKIEDNLTDSMSDEIRNINNEINDLISDLNKAIRHNGRFTANANALTNEKENAVTSDKNLSVAARELSEELTSLRRLKREAEEDRDDYYRKYKEALAREREDDD